jgi:hypothetical protein
MKHNTNILPIHDDTSRQVMYEGTCSCNIKPFLGKAKTGVAALLSDHQQRQGMQLSEGRCVA